MRYRTIYICICAKQNTAKNKNEERQQLKKQNKNETISISCDFNTFKV